ncbi:MAG: ATP-binding protein [Acidobacteriota bacterium]|nr:ATP-binding protein [Acidobacteriota bacterium]
MRKRLSYALAIVILVISITLVVWQGSFNFGPYAPADPEQTLILWGVSTLIFVLMVTLGFILVRTGVKLYIERRSNREGSRIKTKLVVGALALSFMPVFFMVLYSVNVMNRNLDKWFTRPVEAERLDFIQIAEALQKEMQDKVDAQAALLAASPEARLQLAGGTPANDYLKRFCIEHGIAAAQVLRPGTRTPAAAWGKMPPSVPAKGVKPEFVWAHQPVYLSGSEIGAVALASRFPIDVAQKQREIESYNEAYGELTLQRKNIRQSSLLLLALITLFVLFVATWIALFLAKQISVPIAALVHAAEQVSKGNLQHRVEVGAIDELAGLVRGFNQMTHELEANSKELDARRRFTEAILESIPTGVISVAADGSIQRVNRALQRILPHATTVPGMRLEALFGREDAAEIRYLMKRARRTGLASQQLDLKSNSQTQHLAITVSALEDKSTSGFVMVLEDTSDLLRAQRAAAWSEVARRVAHEIKNPLTPIMLSAERIIRQLARAPVRAEVDGILRECAEMILAEAQSVKCLVDEFAQFSRFPAAQPARCDLNEVVESALAVFAGRLDGIEIRTEFAPELPPVHVDREQFKRVVVNLIDNAAEAMQDSLVKHLYIATQAGVADTVELIVADSGCGITADQREKLFLPYFSTKGRGTGLGLAIVNHILADHEAHIRVEDNLPSGARFTIEITTMVEAAELAVPV